MDVSGAMEFLSKAVESFSVVIYSTRCNEKLGIVAMSNWLRLNLNLWAEGDPRGDEVHGKISYATQKPSAFVTIDDRAIQFSGEFPDMETLNKFKPWYVPK